MKLFAKNYIELSDRILKNNINWISTNSTQGINIGEKLSISGIYKKRTLWEKITMKKKEPQVFIVSEIYPNDKIFVKLCQGKE